MTHRLLFQVIVDWESSQNVHHAPEGLPARLHVAEGGRADGDVDVLREGSKVRVHPGSARGQLPS